MQLWQEFGLYDAIYVVERAWRLHESKGSLGVPRLKLHSSHFMQGEEFSSQ